MITLAGIRVTETLHEDPKIGVYRATRETENGAQNVIVKTLRASHPPLEDLAQLRHEWEIARALPLAGVLQPLDWLAHENGFALLTEDFGGVSLQFFLRENAPHGLDLDAFFPLALDLVATLGEVHAHGIIHKDIKPDNIFINAQTRQLKLGDFGIASQLANEPTADNSQRTQGTLLYMSPEQTGRMNQPLDYRTDFYSLGVTFFQMLTGHLPFESEDALEIVHFHLAQTPATPSELRPDVPAVLGEIVLKMLAKTASERYQSASGLRADLENCRAQWSARGEIAGFTLGCNDCTEELRISTKIYGRAAETAALIEAFERAAQGARELVTIAGYSGIGKTSVVGEIHQPIALRRGCFAQGKFDQFRRNVPYSALLEALRALTRNALAASETELARLRARLVKALGTNGQLLVEVIPEIELIVGPQPAVTALGPQESSTRFNFLLGQFVRVWARPEQPLVLFLDDLQWADDASLKFLQMLMADDKIHYLLVVGAYRDNEVSPSHPLRLALDEMRKSGATERQITLEPLDPDSVETWLHDTLRCSKTAARPLAALLIARTAGNPFFLGQLLQSLHEKQLLRCQAGHWNWDLNAISAANLTDNVVELMAGKIRDLPLATQQVLKLAACIGSRFDSDTLDTVSEIPHAHIADNLLAALRAGLISPVSEPLSSGLDAGSAVTYQFLHDRVQQAAYSLVGENERPQLHLVIGRLLLKNTGEAERDEIIFSIVGHLNEARALITDADERHNLVRLNLQAGCKAKAAAAHGPAIEFFAIAQQIAPPQLWRDDYATLFRLARERAESEYVAANFEAAEAQFEIALNHARNARDRADIEMLRVEFYTSRNDYQRAIEVGWDALERLGLPLPKNPSSLSVARVLLQTKRLCGRRPIAAIADRPHLKDARRLAQIGLLATLTAPLYLSAKHNRLALTTLHNVNLSLRYGNSIGSTYGYATYSILLATALGDIKSAVAFNEMATDLASQFESSRGSCSALFTMGCYTAHHLRPLRETVPILQQSYRLAVECGSTLYATYSLLALHAYQSLSGVELNEIEASIEQHLPFIQQSGDGDAEMIVRLIRQVSRNLRGATAGPLSLDGEGFDQDAVRTAVEAGRYSASVQCSFYLYFTRLLAFRGEWPGVLEAVKKAEPLLISLTGTPYQSEQNYFHALALTSLYPQMTAAQQARARKQLRKHRRQMKQKAATSPDNYAHKSLLVEAECARLKGRNQRATALYDEAIASAHAAEFVQNEALANELAARFYAEQGRTKLARAYGDEARYLYEKWGATGKVAALDAATPPRTRTLDARRTTNSLGGDNSSQLDLSTVVKAAQALSGEIDMGRLLQQLLRFALENAGATRGALVLRRDGQLLVEAVGAIGETEMTLPAQPLAQCADSLPLSLVQFVARTRENVVLADATRDGIFTGDDYIVAQKPQSVLCAPIVHQAKLDGLIYLENHLVAGAFTPQRLQVLSVLSAQAAISLQNARLYRQLEDYSRTLQQRVGERTGQLRAKNSELERTLSELRQMQERVIVQEKMASLGALTAGIAHEVKNPLNFINNFALLSMDLTAELREEVEKLLTGADDATRANLGAILDDLSGNSQRINQHGARADTIVRGMLLHSHGQAAELEATDLNALVHEAVQLAYHGQRAHDSSFNATLAEDYDDSIGRIEVLPHEISRVILNLANNACHAVSQKARRLQNEGANSFAPTLRVVTRNSGERIEIRVSDNGDGIPEAARKNIFTPFFTTKPTGQGTGLGLSMSYEIVVQQHGGALSFESDIDTGTVFIIQLPQQKIENL